MDDETIGRQFNKEDLPMDWINQLIRREGAAIIKALAGTSDAPAVLLRQPVAASELATELAAHDIKEWTIESHIDRSIFSIEDFSAT